VLPLLHPADAAIMVVSMRSEPPRVVIRYETGATPNRRERRLTCRFGDPAAGLSTTLVAAETEDGPLAGAVVHLLDRYALRDPQTLREAPPPSLRELAGLPFLPASIAGPLQHALANLALPGIYAMLAAGYALAYGVMDRIHLAFAPLIAIGGIGATLGFMLAISAAPEALTLAMLAAALMALGLGASWGEFSARAVFEPLLRRSDSRVVGLHVLVAGVGLLVVLQEATRLAWGSHTLWLPPFAGLGLPVARSETFLVTLTPSAAIAAAVGFIVCLWLLAAMRATRFGRAWRAVADDPGAAAIVGVDATAVLRSSFTLAGAMAGVAGALIVMTYGGMSFADGAPYAFKALAGAVVGGLGSVGGAMLGGALLGVAEAVWTASMPIADREIAVFTLIVAFLVLRPAGLFGHAETARPGR
jgi:branched-chain amino acid transport system permease protein